MIQILLLKITDKESAEVHDEYTRSQFMQFLWHACIPLFSIQGRLQAASSAEQGMALDQITGILRNPTFIK